MRDAGQDAAGLEALQRRRAAKAREQAASTRERRLPYPILPPNTKAVMLFLRCQTQWIYAGERGEEKGLNLKAVIEVMKTTGIRKRKRANILSRLQVIEMEVLRVFARRRAADTARLRRQQAQSARQQALAAKRGKR